METVSLCRTKERDGVRYEIYILNPRRVTYGRLASLPTRLIRIAPRGDRWHFETGPRGLHASNISSSSSCRHVIKNDEMGGARKMHFEDEKSSFSAGVYYTVLIGKSEERSSL